MGTYTIFQMFEFPRRDRQARNFTTCSENSRSQIVIRTAFFRKLTLGAPDNIASQASVFRGARFSSLPYQQATDNTVEPRFTHIRLILTLRYRGQFSFYSWENPIYLFCLNSTRLIRIPVNADNGQLFLPQSTDSHNEKVNLVNADTSDYALLYVLYQTFPLWRLKNLQLTACRCSQRCSIPNKMICRCQFQTVFWHQTTMQTTRGLD